MNVFPSRNLFSNPSSPQTLEPNPCKKLFVNPPFTPEFGNQIKQPIKLQVTEGIRINQKNQLAMKIQQQKSLTYQLNQISSPSTPKHKEKKLQQSTGEKSKEIQQNKMNKKKVIRNLNKQFEGELEVPKSRYQEEYIQVDILGSGYFGQVYKCKNRFTNQICAIKCTKINNNKLNIDLANESQALAYLNAKGACKNLVRYFTSWQEGNMLYLLMEYCDYSVSSRQDYEEFEIKKILKDITNGLIFLHEQQISHLDIKPENILYSKKDGQYKLADLGLSKKIQKRQEDVNVGDFRYIAKELLNQTEKLDLCKTDIFSLGATLYQLMTRKQLPSNGEEWRRIREGIQINDFPENMYSLRLRKLICRMMDPNPYQRISAKEILEDEYIYVKKENYIKWEKIRGLMLRRQLDEFLIKQREHSI
ncbi:unnamed protein product [Paramecium pentaurelia]|uniref:Protein kinase domain-containing protein n=1 Tax=Paramecium pentaurelia TaxID=43138 RepID=A0A8S1W9W3_9CILI|nr:unnamed protein product [Paramecium pentaurelia]